MWRALLLAVAACSYHAPTTTDSVPDPGSDDPGTAADAAPEAPPPVDVQCRNRYGALDEYDLCSFTEAACTFFVHASPGMPCSAVCTAAGGTCMQSFDGDCADPGNTPHNCGGNLTSQICVCTP